MIRLSTKLMYLILTMIMVFVITGCSSTQSESKSRRINPTKDATKSKEDFSSESILKAPSEDIENNNPNANIDLSKLLEEAINADTWAGSENTDPWDNHIDTDQVPKSDTTEVWSDSVNTDQWSNSIGNVDTNHGFNSIEDVISSDLEILYGSWSIWIPGGAQNWYDIDTGEYVTHEFQAGADAGSIEINRNGSYRMAHKLWGNNETIKGDWRITEPNEINGEETVGIVLIEGIDDLNWAVAPSSNGKIRLLYSSVMTDGSILWIFDSELYQ